MTRRAFFIVAVLGSTLLVAACGTVAPAVYKITEEPAVVESGEQILAQVATSTLVLTELPLPTNTPEPTLAPTIEAALAPTEVVSAGPVEIGSAEYGATDPLKFAVDNFGDAAAGETLFNASILVDEAEWACSTCHSIVPDEVKIGPSQWDVGERALTRVEGEGPYTYLYNSIRNSQAYIVPTYEDKTLMPVYDEDTELTDSQIYNLVAYLLTLHD